MIVVASVSAVPQSCRTPLLGPPKRPRNTGSCKLRKPQTKEKEPQKRKPYVCPSPKKRWRLRGGWKRQNLRFRRGQATSGARLDASRKKKKGKEKEKTRRENWPPAGKGKAHSSVTSYRALVGRFAFLSVTDVAQFKTHMPTCP